MNRRAILMIVFLAIYVVVPVFDVIACDACSDFHSFHRYPASDAGAHKRADVSLQSHDPHENASPSEDAAESHCPLCSNSVLFFEEHSCQTKLSLLSLPCQPVLFVLSDPSYPIVKPPQN